MAESVWGVNDAEAVKLWSRKLNVEVLKETLLGRWMGGFDQDTPVCVFDETNKGAGDRIRSILRMQLSGDGVLGDATLENNEEQIITFTDDLIIDQIRNAVISGGKMSEQRIPFSVRQQALSALRDWGARRLDQAFFNQMCGYTLQTDVRYTGHNTVNAPDSDHHIWASTATNDQSLSNAMPFTLDLIDRCRERAKTLSPGIRPFKINGEELFAIVLHPYQVHDMRTSTSSGQWLDIQKAILAAGGELTTRNPIFTGALGMYNKTIIYESDLVTNGIHSVNNTVETDVRRAVFFGAHACSMGFGREYSGAEMWKWVEQYRDYRNKLGVAAGLIYGLKKARYNSKDYGSIVVSTYAIQH